MDNNSYYDLVQALFYVEHGGLKLDLKLAKPLTCMTVAYNSILSTAMCGYNR